MICSDCKEECQAHVVNFGIGRGEAWGVPFNDVQNRLVSKCCDAPLEDDDGRELDDDEVPYGPGNPDYECDSRMERDL